MISTLFTAWEEEIKSYETVVDLLLKQKEYLTSWDMDKFSGISLETERALNRAHQKTEIRQNLLNSFAKQEEEKIDLQNLGDFLTDSTDKLKAEAYFVEFKNLLKLLDKISTINKELIKTGLSLVGDNIEIIKEATAKSHVYSKVGIVFNQNCSLLFNKRI